MRSVCGTPSLEAMLLALVSISMTACFRAELIGSVPGSGARGGAPSSSGAGTEPPWTPLAADPATTVPRASVFLAQSSELLVADESEDSTGALLCDLRALPSAGAAGTVLDSYQLSPGWEASPQGLAVNPADDSLWAVGSATDAHGVSHWIVRSAAGASSSWSTIDDFNLVSGINSAAAAIAISVSGSVYVAGSATDASGIQRWLVRKGGSNIPFAASDNFVPGDGYGAMANAVAIDATSGDVVVGGTQGDSSAGDASGAWVVRTLSSGAWQTTDAFATAANQNAEVHGLVALGSSGGVLAFGFADDAAASPHWLVRARGESSSWSTEDDYQLVSGGAAFATAGTVDSSGNPVISGAAIDAHGTLAWIARSSGQTLDFYQTAAGGSAMPLTATVGWNGDLITGGIQWSGTAWAEAFRGLQ